MVGSWRVGDGEGVAEERRAVNGCCLTISVKTSDKHRVLTSVRSKGVGLRRICHFPGKVSGGGNALY